MRNRIRCLKCHTIIESRHRHDFVWCPCHAVYIDGGLDYKRMGGDLSKIMIVQDDDTELPLKEYEDGLSTERAPGASQ